MDICKFCDNSFKSTPIVLPCGYTVCDTHVKNGQLTSCIFCPMFHSSADNYIVNKDMELLLNQRTLVKHLHELSAKLNTFKSIQSDPYKQYASFFFDQLKDEIHLRENESVKSLHSHFDSMIVRLENLDEFYKLGAKARETNLQKDFGLIDYTDFIEHEKDEILKINVQNIGESQAYFDRINSKIKKIEETLELKLAEYLNKDLFVLTNGQAKIDHESLYGRLIVKQEYTQEKIHQEADSLIEEFLKNKSLNDSLKTFEDFQPTIDGHLREFVKQLMVTSFDHDDEARRFLGDLFFVALKENKLSKEHFFDALKQVLLLSDDTQIDVPKMKAYLCTILAPVYASNDEIILSAFEDFIDKPFSSNLLNDILHQVAQKMSHNLIAFLRQTNAKLRSKFSNRLTFDRSKFDWLFDYETRLSGLQNSIVQEFYESKIIGILKSNQDSTNILDRIDLDFNQSDFESKLFIRALVISVFDQCLTVNLNFDAQLFKQRVDVLKKFIDSSNDEFQLEALFAVQFLINKLKQPKDLLRMFFDALYDANLVRRDIFWKWKSGEKEGEEEAGYLTCLLSLREFFDALREVDPNVYN